MYDSQSGLTRDDVGSSLNASKTAHQPDVCSRHERCGYSCLGGARLRLCECTAWSSAVVLLSLSLVGTLSGCSLSLPAAATPINICGTFKQNFNNGVTNSFRSCSRSGLTVMRSAMMARSNAPMRTGRMIDAQLIAQMALLI